MVDDEVVREIQRLYPGTIGAILSGLDEGQRELVIHALRLLAHAIRRHES